ncbi:MFS transporter, DHA1 family, multidrug resistance protein [Pelosinus fermentans]|uniref:MFS transporter n=1 Tax=Pelosinus fermentans TaxID=365349 RepID=UPI0002684AF4|nr:MFS transporter [Pelosinus fermentans]OAM96254.1 major facilitator superfamily MFS_1 [Pelosinus fermentans DSM 17108]SDR38066.1 MFS transporter, DHA1 family, multidrug resistance protein [Pelosinus fermentans]
MGWRRNLWVLSIAVMLSGSSYTMVTPFLPLYLLDIGVSQSDVNVWSGIIFSISFLVSAIMAPYWGRHADKNGKRRMIMRAGFSLAVVYFLGAFVRNPVDLLLVRILQGFANGFVPASMAIIASSVPKEKMGFSLGVMQTTLLMGGILGPLMGGSLSHFFGMRLSFVIAAGIIFVGTVGVGILVKEPVNNERPSEGSMFDDLKIAFHNRKLVEMLLLLFGAQMISMTLQPLITLYVAELQGNMEGVALTAGIIYSMAGIAGAISAPMWGKLGQKKGFIQILVIAFIGAGIFNMGQFFIVNIYQFSVLQFFFGLFIVGVYPAINTIAVNSTDKAFQGRIFGLTTTANHLGSMVGPLVGGMISSWLGIGPVFLFTGSVLIMIGLLVFFKIPRATGVISKEMK